MFFQVGSELANKQLDQVSKKYKNKFFACELAIRRVALLIVRRRRTQYGIEEDAGLVGCLIGLASEKNASVWSL